MTKVIEIDPEKDLRWDQFVDNHPLGWIVHHSGWKRLLENSFPHMKGHYLVVVNSANQAIRAALPLFEVRSWLTGNRLVSIPMAQLCDPLVDNEQDMALLLEEAFNLSRDLNTAHIEIRAFNAPLMKTDKRLKDDELYRHHFIPLDENPEKLKKSFHNKAVNQAINRAVKNNLHVEIAQCEDDLKEFHLLFTQTRKNIGVPYLPYHFLKSLWNIFYPLNMAVLLLAKRNEQIASGILFFQFNGRFSGEFEGWNREFSAINPNHLVFWEAIKLACKNGNDVFDFGITDPKNEGLVTFKERWGTKVMDLHRYYYTEKKDKSFIVNETSFKQKFIEGVCRKSPEFIYRRFGNFCFRHMG